LALFETNSALLDKHAGPVASRWRTLLQLADRIAVRACYISKLSSRFPYFKCSKNISPLGHLAAYCDGDEHISRD